MLYTSSKYIYYIYIKIKKTAKNKIVSLGGHSLVLEYWPIPKIKMMLIANVFFCKENVQKKKVFLAKTKQIHKETPVRKIQNTFGEASENVGSAYTNLNYWPD